MNKGKQTLTEMAKQHILQEEPEFKSVLYILVWQNMLCPNAIAPLKFLKPLGTSWGFLPIDFDP